MIATSSHLLWYTTRATGVVALVLLTGTVVLGVLTSVRFGTTQWPRFALADLHRRVSLLSMVFIALHVVTTVSDSYAPIGWVSAFVPFTSSYRRLWLGLGTVAVDLLLAVTVSSLLRQRISHRAWRALHWLAYASWPVALLHGLGTGTDPHLRWMVLLTIACVAAVLTSIGWRLVSGWPADAGRRVVAGAKRAGGDRDCRVGSERTPASGMGLEGRYAGFSARWVARRDDDLTSDANALWDVRRRGESVGRL